MKIIDVSKHNGIIDWVKVKASGIDGAIIRAGYGRDISQKDTKFETNYANAVAVGLHVGAYWYSYATTVLDAAMEAEVFKKCINGKKFDLPVYFDIEEKKHVNYGKSVCSEMADKFCITMERAGYFAGIYSFDSFFVTNLTAEVQAKYSCWVARVENIKPTACKKYDMHQYSWKGRIDGIVGDVDVNECYRDFPTIIRNAGLNGYTKPSNIRSVTASAVGVSNAKANVIKSACEQMGMDVVIT